MLPSTPRYYKWSLSFGCPHQTPACLSVLTHACHTSLPYDVTRAMDLIDVYKLETFCNTITIKKYVINVYWKGINKCVILIIEVTCEDKDVPVHDVKAY
jgi:hypothetical protein